MPRVKPLIRPDPRETEIRAEVGAAIAALRITQSELAKRVGIAPSTFSRRMEHPGDFRIRELNAIRDLRKREGV